MAAPARSRVVRFGIFEIDPATGELRKGGALVRIRGQPAAILVALVARPGEVVTREEIRRELWADGTFVDFDQSINAAVKRLRAALGDEAELPRFIETLPGQGYRFIAPVHSETVSSPTPSPPAPGARRRVWTFAGSFILVVAVAVGAAWLTSSRIRVRWPWSTSAPIQSLAVLPLKNLSPDAKLDYFVDGVTESLIAELSRIHTLKVISRTSVMRYKETTESAPDIARRLRVDAIVEGSVARSADRARITVQLIDGRTDEHVWSQSYERPLGDVLVLQREVTRAIAQAIGVTLTAPEADRLNRVERIEPRAHESYLQGRFYWNQRTESSLRRALALFQSAIDLDPRYAQPHAGLADVYGLLPRYDTSHPRESLLNAKQHALKALELDPSLSEARTALAKMQYTLDFDWAAADEGFRRAIDLDPGYATAHHWYSILLLIVGRVQEGVDAALRAAELDPLSVVIKSHAAWVLYLAGQIDRATVLLNESLAMAPDHAPSHSLVGWIAMSRSEFDIALRAFSKAVELYKGDARALAHLAAANARAGRTAEAERILATLRQRALKEPVPIEAFVLCYAALQRNNEAFSWLQRSFNDRSVSFYLFDLRLEPIYAGLRLDARLASMFRDVGLDLPGSGQATAGRASATR